MFIAHLIVEFVFQPLCLGKYKEKDWWKTQYENGEVPDLYKYDYMMGLLQHSITWSCFQVLPWLLLSDTGHKLTLAFFIFNMVGHYLIDDLKANKKKINLVEEQSLNLIQILTTWYGLVFLSEHLQQIVV